MADGTSQDTDIEQLLAEDTEPTSDNFVQMRNALKAKDREVKELRQFRESAEPQLRQYAVKEAGFDPESPKASALLKLHEGEFTPDALRQTAASYGLADEFDGSGQGDPAQQLTDEERQAIESSQRGQQVAATGTPIEPQDINAQILAAQQQGDFAEVDRLNTIKRQRLMART